MEFWIAFRPPWHVNIRVVKDWQRERDVKAFIGQLERMLEWRKAGKL